jgi:Domain of unknown function (DUF4303)
VVFHSFDDLRKIFRDDARSAFLDLVQHRSGEQICAFALVTDEEACGASGAGDTVERRERRLASRIPCTRAEEKFHAWEYTWHPSEWDAIYTEERPNTRPETMSARDYFHGMISFRKEWISVSGRSVQAFRRNALRAMINALADLDSEGLFGHGKEREAITVFLDMPDSNDSDTLKFRSVHELNPRVAAVRLKRALPVSGRLINIAVGLTQWFVRGHLIARATSK